MKSVHFASQNVWQNCGETIMAGMEAGMSAAAGDVIGAGVGFAGDVFGAAMSGELQACAKKIHDLAEFYIAHGLVVSDR